MKVFLRKTSMFAALILFMYAIVIYLNYSFVASTKFSFDKDKKILVLGDSNIKYAVNDSIFDISANFSGEADSYFYSFLKLNKILEDKANSFKTVFLSFSPHNIIGNNWVFNEEDMVTRFPKYYPLMSKADLMFLFEDKNDIFLSSLGRVFREFPSMAISKIKDPFIVNYGGFKFVNSYNLDLELDKLSKEEPIPIMPSNSEISKQETTYLLKIVELCKSNNLNLILINPPKRKELLVHKKYFVTEFEHYYNDKLSNIAYLDFSNISMPDDYYSDLVHLNYKGAAYFSNLLKSQDLKELTDIYIK